MVNRASMIDEVQSRVASAFALSRAELLSRSRRRPVALARQVAMYLCREVAQRGGERSSRWASYPRIGLAFARDHSSVIHACNVVSERRARDRGLADLLDELTRELRPASPLIIEGSAE
jgi:chromosomal replication initiator protein